MIILWVQIPNRNQQTHITADSGFTQIVDTPTHGSNLLDILFTNRPSLIDQCVPVAGISDHDAILTTFHTKELFHESTKRKVHLWDLSNFDEIKAQLLTFNEYFLETFTMDTPIENLWLTLHHKLMELMDKYVPSRVVNKNVKQTWINHDIKQL